MVDVIGGAVTESKPEVIGYPVVGQPEKVGDNVIGYDVREEQSIYNYSILNGASSVSNGEATIVYGVNAPKIIADTSVVIDDVSLYSAKLFGASPQMYVYAGSKEIVWIHSYEIQESKGDYEFTFNSEGMVFPTKGNFKMEIKYDYRGSSRPFNTRMVMNEWTSPVIIAEKTTGDSYVTEEVYFTAEQGDVLSTRFEVQNNASGNIGGSAYVRFTITRIS